MNNIEYGIKSLLSEGITERALFLLIQSASPVCGDSGRQKKPTIGQIRAVMQGLNNLYEFCFGTEEKEN